VPLRSDRLHQVIGGTRDPGFVVPVLLQADDIVRGIGNGNTFSEAPVPCLAVQPEESRAIQSGIIKEAVSVVGEDLERHTGD